MLFISEIPSLYSYITLFGPSSRERTEFEFKGGNVLKYLTASRVSTEFRIPHDGF